MGLITPEIVATATAAIDSLMLPAEQGGLGKHCTLLFPPKAERCPNCGWDSPNKRSNNRYKAGGPQPFPTGTTCPVCMGRGTLDTPVSQDIVFLCNWNPRTWATLPGINPANFNAQVPGGAVQTKGFLSDLPAVLQSRRVVIESPVEALRRYTFALDGEPVDTSNIIQGRYFYAVWRRAAQ